MLPDNVLDALLERVFEANPLLRFQFLTSLGPNMHASAVRVLFRQISVEDDMRIYSSFNPQILGPSAALLHNAARYGSAVQCLTICDPTHFDNFEPQRRSDHSPLLQLSSLNVSDDDDAPAFRNLIEPLSAIQVAEFLTACGNITELIWSSATPPPNGLCEVLAHNNQKLVRFAFTPQPPLIPHSPQVPVHSRFVSPRWDGASLPMLASLPIRILHLHRLSQAGARALGSLLSKLGDNSTIEELSLDFLWLDDALCERIAQASKKLQRLCLSTNGTKLTDRGVLTVLEIDGLEELKLKEVEGRLSKRLWQRAHFPATLTCFSVDISEAGPHHSWVSDHLTSLSQTSFSSLTTLRIARTIHAFDRKLDDVAALQSLPSDLTISLRDAKALRVLECDWWAWPAEKLKDVIHSCNRLQVLRVAFDGPFIKLLGLTSTFAPASLLQTLHVYISPVHAPSGSSLTYTHPLTPSASPVVASVTTLPTTSDASSIEENRSGTLPIVSDPHLPPIREVKKFVRRCQALTLLEWYGWNGRGSWIVGRPPGVAKSTVSVTVDHIPPPLPSHDLLQRYSLEEDAARVGWLAGAAERQGCLWTGAIADEHMLEHQTGQREREEFVTPVKSKPRKSSSSFSSNLQVSTEVLAELPPTPTSANKAPPVTPTSGRKLWASADSRTTKPVGNHSKHRRATMEAYLPVESKQRLGEEPSGRRKSIGGKAGNKTSTSSNAPTRSAAGSRQFRTARISDAMK